MTSLELYQQFLIKVNKNDTSRNIKVPKSKFVLIFNEQQRQYVDEIEDKGNSSRRILRIKELLKLDFELTKVDSLTNRDIFELPADFDEYSSSYSICSKDACQSVVYNWELKPTNKTVLLQDENNKPSFEYQETIAALNGNHIDVYKDGFSVDKVFLDYYKQPVGIDIEGYTKIDGTESTNVDPELSDKDLDKIIDLCALEVTRNYEDSSKFQLAQTRIVK